MNSKIKQYDIYSWDPIICSLILSRSWNTVFLSISLHHCLYLSQLTKKIVKLNFFK